MNPRLLKRKDVDDLWLNHIAIVVGIYINTNELYTQDVTIVCLITISIKINMGIGCVQIDV